MTDKAEADKFEGFEVPQSNYFRLPNEWTEITATIKSLAELKVIEYVLRHTWGYREYEKPKAITTDEFAHGRRRRNGERMDSGTGLSKRGVMGGIQKAVEDGYLVVEVDATDQGRIKKAYKLHMTENEQEQEKEQAQSAPQRGKLCTPEGQSLHPVQRKTL